jgi:hypothetical protein
VSERATFEGWCVLELFGHRRLAGMVMEQEIAGASFLRIDVPAAEGGVAATQLYSASAIYAITPTTEEVARAFGARHQPAPVTQWELPRLPAAVAGLTDDTDADGDGHDRGPF